MAKGRIPARFAKSQPELKHDWKSSPVIVAGGTAAATILLGIAVVTQVIVPTQTAKIEIESLKAKDQLRTSLDTIRRLESQVAALEKKSKENDSQLKKLASDLLVAREGAMFSGGNPYPVGLGLVRVGDEFAAIERAYPGRRFELDSKAGTLEVELEDSPFKHVSYGFLPNDPRRRIVQVSYLLDYNRGYPDGFLRGRIVEALGSSFENPEDDKYRWRVSDGSRAYLLGETYIVLASGYIPRVWPER